MLKLVRTCTPRSSQRPKEHIITSRIFTFWELTTVSSELNCDGLGDISSDIVLCRFFSRTVGNCEESETTEGLGRRPCELEESLLSFVDSVELLADDECLLSVAGVEERFPVARSTDGSQAGSCLNGRSILHIYECGIHVCYIYNAAMIIATQEDIQKCNMTQRNVLYVARNR